MPLCKNLTFQNFLLQLQHDTNSTIPETLQGTSRKPKAQSNLDEQQVGEVLWKATIHDVVGAIIARYESDDVPDDIVVNTKVVVSPQAMQNLELLSFKTGIMKDPMTRLILEHYFTNRLHNTKQNP